LSLVAGRWIPHPPEENHRGTEAQRRKRRGWAPVSAAHGSMAVEERESRVSVTRRDR
jgi:hypothetical protein